MNEFFLRLLWLVIGRCTSSLLDITEASSEEFSSKLLVYREEFKSMQKEVVVVLPVLQLIRN